MFEFIKNLFKKKTKEIEISKTPKVEIIPKKFDINEFTQFLLTIVPEKRENVVVRNGVYHIFVSFNGKLVEFLFYLNTDKQVNLTFLAPLLKDNEIINFFGQDNFNLIKSHFAKYAERYPKAESLDRLKEAKNYFVTTI